MYRQAKTAFGLAAAVVLTATLAAGQAMEKVPPQEQRVVEQGALIFVDGVYQKPPLTLERRERDVYLNGARVRTSEHEVTEVLRQPIGEDPGDAPPGLSPLTYPEPGQTRAEFYVEAYWPRKERYLMQHHPFEEAMHLLIEAMVKASEAPGCTWYVDPDRTSVEPTGAQITIVKKETGGSWPFWYSPPPPPPTEEELDHYAQAELDHWERMASDTNLIWWVFSGGGEVGVMTGNRGGAEKGIAVLSALLAPTAAHTKEAALIEAGIPEIFASRIVAQHRDAPETRQAMEAMLQKCRDRVAWMPAEATEKPESLLWE